MTSRDTGIHVVAAVSSPQDVSVRNIDPEKPATRLRRRFPADSFESYVRISL
jgi:hypothetical protein